MILSLPQFLCQLVLVHPNLRSAPYSFPIPITNELFLVAAYPPQSYTENTRVVKESLDFLLLLPPPLACRLLSSFPE